jgi:hypothetical protein
MRHHSDYLLSNIKIIEWHLTAKLGLQCTYEIEGIIYHLLAAPFRLTTLLSNVYLIDDRRIKDGNLQVHHNGVWKPFQWYVSDADYDSVDLVRICAEHESTKMIEEIKESYIIANCKPICPN